MVIYYIIFEIRSMTERKMDTIKEMGALPKKLKTLAVVMRHYI